MKEKVNILVVEGEPGVSLMMVSLLNRIGCEVAAAWNAKKAIRLALERDFDLITLDIQMPGISGFDLCQTLMACPRSADTPIIFVTACPCEADRHHAFELGAVDYIVKPFETNDFIHRIICQAKIRKPLEIALSSSQILSNETVAQSGKMACDVPSNLQKISCKVFSEGSE